MGKWLATGLVAMTLVGCSMHDYEEPKVTRVKAEITNEQAENAKSLLLSSLKDPDSSRLVGLYGTREPHEQEASAVCGLVNAKNSYGGYAGERHFAVTMRQVFIFTANPVYGIPNDNIAVFNLCTTED